MVRGLETFRRHFAGLDECFVVIGGVACDEWFAANNLAFRITKDVDMVLLLEATSPAFISRFWDFVKAGRYENRQKSTGKRIYYRFQDPVQPDYPETVELFSRAPAGIDLSAGQEVAPIPADEDQSSLSAILMDDAYYELVVHARETRQGLALLRPEALIALKAAAWLDLTRRKAEGQTVATRDVKKHRNDVFRLAHILPAGEHVELSPVVAADLRAFLAAHPPELPDWNGIIEAVRTSIPVPMAPATVLNVLADYYRLGTAQR